MLSFETMSHINSHASSGGCIEIRDVYLIYCTWHCIVLAKEKKKLSMLIFFVFHFLCVYIHKIYIETSSSHESYPINQAQVFSHFPFILHTSFKVIGLIIFFVCEYLLEISLLFCIAWCENSSSSPHVVLVVLRVYLWNWKLNLSHFGNNKDLTHPYSIFFLHKYQKFEFYWKLSHRRVNIFEQLCSG